MSRAWASSFCIVLTMRLVPATLVLLSSCSDSEPTTSRVSPATPVEAPATISAPAPAATRPAYPWHRGITATVFWVGEPASKGSPTNVASAWDERWMERFGGFDDPKRRDGFLPAGFVPRENPFYVALPYNDFRRGGRDPEAARRIPWFDGRTWGRRESACKNRWVQITANGRTAYAQWQDVGPFVTDDADYVFGGARPRNTSNQSAGIDVSPAVRDALGLRGMDRVDWRFIEGSDVPDGPWRRVVTSSQVHWE